MRPDQRALRQIFGGLLTGGQCFKADPFQQGCTTLTVLHALKMLLKKLVKRLILIGHRRGNANRLGHQYKRVAPAYLVMRGHQNPGQCFTHNAAANPEPQADCAIPEIGPGIPHLLPQAVQGGVQPFLEILRRGIGQAMPDEISVTGVLSQNSYRKSQGRVSLLEADGAAEL